MKITANHEYIHVAACGTCTVYLCVCMNIRGKSSIDKQESKNHVHVVALSPGSLAHSSESEQESLGTRLVHVANTNY